MLTMGSCFPACLASMQHENGCTCNLPCRSAKDELVKAFIEITKNDTIMNNWLGRARLIS